MCEGGSDCVKYLKREWDKKEGRGNKDFKKGGKLGQGVGALKRGGRGWNPLMNYVEVLPKSANTKRPGTKFQVAGFAKISNNFFLL